MTYLQGLIIGLVCLVLGAVGQLKLPKYSAGRTLSFLPFVVGVALTGVSGGRLAGRYAMALYLLVAAGCVSVALVGAWKAQTKQNS